MSTDERLPPHKMSVDFRRSVAIADLIAEQKDRDGLLPTIAQIVLAIRESDEAVGMVLVPREATEKMALAGCLSLPHNEQTLLRWQRDPAAKDLELDDMDASWRAMIAAATEADNG